MGTENAAEAQKKAPKRNTDPDDEDLELLGYAKPQASDAVTIIKPPSTRPARPNKIYTGGHRPMNTLSTSSTLPSPTQFPRQTEIHKKPQPLVVDVSRGYNVRKNEAEGSDETFGSHQSVKRQKTVHPNSASSISSESVDELPAEIVRYGGGKAGKSPVRSQRSQLPASSMDIEARFAMASEFGGLEDMMNSSQRKGKRKKQSRLRNATSPLINLISKPDPVEVESDEDQTIATRGSHRVHTNKAPRSQQPKLPLHNSTSESKFQNKTLSPYFQLKLGRSRPSAEDEGNLRTTFVASNGSRRGQDHLSSDELDGPATIGEHADVIPLSPGVRRQAVSPKKSASLHNSKSTSPEEQPVEPSNIKPTIFASQTPNKGRANHQEDFDKDYFKGETFPWVVNLVAVNLLGQELYQSSDLKLAYNKESKIYFVLEGRGPLNVAGSRLEIEPRRLQRIWWEQSGKKVRFQSSRKGNTDNILDLELESEKDLSILIKRLQFESSHVKIVSEESEKMQKRFEVRRKQSLRPVKPSLVESKDIEDDVQMAAINQQRRQSQALAGQQISNTSRRRTNLLNSLVHKMTSDNEPVDPQEDLPRTKQDSHSDHANSDSADKPLGRPSVFSKVQLPHNDHLNVRRSTRASSSIVKYLEQSPERQESKAKKYSVEVGLGERWSKPLSYPKVGKKKTTVEFDDLVRLDDDEFLNDNLVSFYMRYLEQLFTEKTPELARTVYFFNSFFYDRLNTPQRGQRGINYEGVQRWTRGVDLFSYDYVIVPINELAHWYVAIICNLPALGQSEDSSKEASSPIIATDVEQMAVLSPSVEEKMQEPQERQARQSFAELSLDGSGLKRQPSEDSLIGKAETRDLEPAIDADEDHEMLDMPNATHKQIDLDKPVDLEKPDLIEDTDEGPKLSVSARKQKRKSMLPAITKRDPASPVIITFDSFGHPHSNVIKVLKQYLYAEGSTKKNVEFDVGKIRGITAKNIPQQKNFSDCGLYMLGYVEKFLEDHPKDFIGKIIRREFDVQKDWPKMDPSNMRKSLREQLQKLHEEDEAERIAMKNAKRASGSREAVTKTPPAENHATRTEEAASIIRPKNKEDATSDPEKHEAEERPPLDVQHIRNAKYNPPSSPQDDQPNPILDPPQNPNTANSTSSPTQDDSLIVVDNPDHTSSTIKASPNEIPSSQPPHDPKPNEDISPPSPVLPTEIKDSQPQHPQTQTPSNPPHKPSPEPTAALPTNPSNPPPPEEEKEQQIQTIFSQSPEQPEKNAPSPQNMVYTDWRPAATATDAADINNNNNSSNARPSPPRSGKRGVAQKVQPPPAKRQQQQQRGKKMTREEAIVLD